jgi:hypothetical protein
MKLYQSIATSIQAVQTLRSKGDKYSPWCDAHKAKLEAIEFQVLPSGAGIDHGSHFVFGGPSKNREFRIDASYHKMDDHGGYDGWIDFSVIVTPDWHDINVDVRLFGETSEGEDDDALIDYLTDLYHGVLTEECPEDLQYAENPYTSTAKEES